MKRSAFTLVEMAIAVSISVILMGIALPRFNELLNQQEFFTEVQNVSSCIQQAQSLAAAPSGALLVSGKGALRWVAAEVVETGGVRQCKIYGIDSTVTYDELLLTTPSDQLAVPRAPQNIAQVESEDFRVYFGVQEKGVPVKYVSEDPVRTQTAPLGTGMKVTVPFVSARDTQTTVTVVIEQAGAPIHVVRPVTP